jgi:hypothetical protein
MWALSTVGVSAMHNRGEMLSADGHLSCCVLVHSRGVYPRQFAHLGHTLARQADSCGGMPQRGFCARQVMLNMRVEYIFGHAHYAMIYLEECVRQTGLALLAASPSLVQKIANSIFGVHAVFLCKKGFK